VLWLERNPQLWAYVGSKSTTPPHFTREPGAHTKEEVFYRLSQTVQAYEQVETLPHHPRIANHYYADPVLPESTGEHLDRLLDFFSPETDADRAIMRTAIVTPFWGGPPGQRPMFVVTSDAGRGAGKSTIAQVCERLAGGMLNVNPLEDIGRVKNRLLSPEGLLRRVAVLDNVKSMRFSWGDLEGLVTSTTVSGHRLHHGEASRPNLFTWYMTMNGLDLSTDMAKRCVILKIRKPAWRGDWLEELLKFIDTNRLSIISDCIAHLSGERTALGKSTRWGLWEKYVLGLEHDSEKILSLIISRQESADVEDEESQTLEAHIAVELDKMNMHSETMKCYISLRAMHMWFREALRDRSRTVMETARIVRQKIAEGGCRRLTNSTSHRHGRGFVWTGEACFANQEVWSNLDDSLESRGKNSFEPF
jgi:hypothetical protein